jgi:hypothetical protein
LQIKSSKRRFLFAKKAPTKSNSILCIFTESWANKCGEDVTKEKSIGEMVLE